MPTTFDIHIQPRYLPEHSSPLNEVYRFVYAVAIRNTGDQPAQLVARQWDITDADGHRERVRGLGVVGHQPYLKPGELFEYASGCTLCTPTGTMQGHYRFLTLEGDAFDVPIASFTLDATGQCRVRRRG